MKWKAKYSAEADVPDDVKAFYHLKGGEWVFNWEEFEDLDALSNASLAANRDTILEEKKNMATAKKAAEDRVSELEAEVNKIKKPGTIIMSSDDQKALEDYKALGTVKDIKTKLDNETELTSKLSAVETEKEVRTLAKKLGLNEDALVDFKLNSERGKDVALAIGKKKVKNKKNEEEEVEIPVVVITDTVNGKEKETQVEFVEYAKTKNFPQYLVDAIFAEQEQNGNGHGKKKEEKRTPFSVPRTTTAKVAGEESASKTLVQSRLEKFNSNRSTRKLPWSAKKESE